MAYDALNQRIKNLDQAFTTVRKNRLSHRANSDIWDLSLHWQEQKQGIQQLLVKGEYRLEPLVLFRHDGGGTCSYWGSLDAVILKAISIALTSGFTSQNEMTSYHMKGRGGLKGAVRAVKEKIGEYHFVLKIGHCELLR